MSTDALQNAQDKLIKEPIKSWRYSVLVRGTHHREIRVSNDSLGGYKARFSYNRPDRPDRPNRLKERDGHMEKLPGRSQTTRTTETTPGDDLDRLDRIEFYPNNLDDDRVKFEEIIWKRKLKNDLSTWQEFRTYCGTDRLKCWSLENVSFAVFDWRTLQAFARYKIKVQSARTSCGENRRFIKISFSRY